jgi:hypothetical protein
MHARFATAAALAALGVAITLGTAACGGDDDETSPPAAPPPSTTTVQSPPPPPPPQPPPPPPAPPKVQTVTIVVEGGVPKGGVVRPKVDKGEKVRLVVRSDVADEVHLHGYDISKDVAAGGRATIVFVADIPGRFEVELEERGVQLADITVQ